MGFFFFLWPWWAPKLCSYFYFYLSLSFPSGPPLAIRVPFPIVFSTIICLFFLSFAAPQAKSPAARFYSILYSILYKTKWFDWVLGRHWRDWLNCSRRSLARFDRGWGMDGVWRIIITSLLRQVVWGGLIPTGGRVRMGTEWKCVGVVTFCCLVLYCINK